MVNETLGFAQRAFFQFLNSSDKKEFSDLVKMKQSLQICCGMCVANYSI